MCIWWPAGRRVSTLSLAECSLPIQRLRWEEGLVDLAKSSNQEPDVWYMGPTSETFIDCAPLASVNDMGMMSELKENKAIDSQMLLGKNRFAYLHLTA